MNIESHLLLPFLPANARLLMLGSFPPQQKRWCMDFYYPNYQNDMWRIIGTVFFADRNYFVDTEARMFRKEQIVEFLKEKGIALYDTATMVRRLQDNASDKFLEVVEPADVAGLLRRLPLCKAVVATGQKAADTLCALFQVRQPVLGHFASFLFEQKEMRIYRMPSSSRAYPLPVEKKAGHYAAMFRELDMLG